MFCNNTGPQISAIAIVFAIIEALTAIIFGVILIVYLDSASFIGIIVMVLGILMAYLSHLILAGFGELVSNSHQILNLLKPERSGKEEAAPSTPEESVL